MCGIAGFYGMTDIPPRHIAACLELMRRRGPDHSAHDGERTSHGAYVHLLHTRLKIIDLDERANQPFKVGPRRMVYNGELYNYVELRKELAALDVHCVTQSDTEVFMKALEHWGWEGLDRCEGMWALALYDRSDGSLTLSRDRFGEKPLYLYRNPSGLYFGSEPKLIACLLGHPLSINIEHLYRYLVNGYKSLYKDGKQFFHGLEELPPGSILRLSPTRMDEHGRYWKPALRPDETMSYENAVVGVRERLIRSVELRLRADVPLAFCMSGGVDSNSLISIAKNVCGYNVHGFTIVNSDTRYEEQEMVEHAVSKLGIRHTAVPIDTNEFLPRLRLLVRYHDAPVYTITYFAHWLLMANIADCGYRISVSGTAADELFTGYYDHHLAYLYELRGDPTSHALAKQAWERDVRPIVRNPYLQDADAFLKNPEMRDHVYFEAAGFAQYLRSDWEEPFTEQSFTSSLLRNRMLNEVCHETVPVILHEDDLNAMYFSIENRSPYLDRELFEFCFSIPTRHLIQNGLAKAVLRDAMRGIVPDRILDNPRKVGFNAPIFSFLDVSVPTVREALLDPSPIFEHVHRDRIETLIGKAHLPNSESKFLFYFLSSKMFLEEFAA